MKSEDTQNSTTLNAQPTPPSEETVPNSAYAAYVPHDIKYDSAFEDSLMTTILDSDVSATLDDSSAGADVVSTDSLPSIDESELPLSLSDPRRKFPSPISGILLTHPGGYLEGGPGLDPEMDTFVEDFVERNAHITAQSTADDLRTAVQQEVDSNMEMLRERLRERRKAIERNEQIERELRLMSDQHAMEMKINRKLADERRAKKEAKERRRRGER